MFSSTKGYLKIDRTGSPKAKGINSMGKALQKYETVDLRGSILIVPNLKFYTV